MKLRHSVMRDVGHINKDRQRSVLPLFLVQSGGDHLRVL